MSTPPTPQLPPLVQQVCHALPAGHALYLVGGAVRDLLLNRGVHDLDFVVPGPAIPLARKLANALGGHFYPLDAARDAGRVLLPDQHAALDFITLQGGSLAEDLAQRDFTINAMALSLPDATLHDPLGGAADLRAKSLRMAGLQAFHTDPIRILRAVRMAASFGLQIEPQTRQALRAAVPQLGQVSAERQRDELLRLLQAPKPATSLRALDLFGALSILLPELGPLKGLGQSAPHIYDVWEHSLQVVDKLGLVFSALDDAYPAEGVGELVSGLTVLRLGRFRNAISQHLAAEAVPGRPRRALLLLGALLHDAGKALTRSVEPGGRIRFFEHEVRGAELAVARAQALHFSNGEVEYLHTLISQHMRPFLLTQVGTPPSRRAIYRFFEASGPVGVDVCLLALADLLGKRGPHVDEPELTATLDTLRALLAGYYEQAEEVVSPPALLNGNDLMTELGLKPGRKVGEILKALREAQAMGKVPDRDAALAFARQQVRSGQN
ncbi:MAG: HD domain-containing protein [Anaerolineales bacterium]|nr:HD domain-containing protein [Anaerolineales bacterium]